jgi:hypothetical protein
MTTVVFTKDHPPAYKAGQLVHLPDGLAYELERSGVVEIRPLREPTETKEDAPPPDDADDDDSDEGAP